MVKLELLVKVETEIKNGELRVTGDDIAFSGSDRNLKENITVIPNALDKINSISGNTFKWKASTGYDYLDES